MLYLVDNAVYMQKQNGYTRYAVRETVSGAKYLEETGEKLSKLPASYQVCTLKEVFARVEPERVWKSKE